MKEMVKMYFGLLKIQVKFLIIEIQRFVVSSVSVSLSHWYPGSGVVLDCIDS